MRVRNPKTGKFILEGGPTHRRLLRLGVEFPEAVEVEPKFHCTGPVYPEELVQVDETHFQSPKTGKPILFESPDHCKLKREGYIIDETYTNMVPYWDMSRKMQKLLCRIYGLHPKHGREKTALQAYDQSKGITRLSKVQRKFYCPHCLEKRSKLPFCEGCWERVDLTCPICFEQAEIPEKAVFCRFCLKILVCKECYPDAYFQTCPWCRKDVTEMNVHLEKILQERTQAHQARVESDRRLAERVQVEWREETDGVDPRVSELMQQFLEITEHEDPMIQEISRISLFYRLTRQLENADQVDQAG